MNNIIIRQLTNQDYEEVHQVDILTQKQYLGPKWDNLSDKEKEQHLISRKKEFLINVNCRYSFVAIQNNIIIGFIFAYETQPFLGNIYIRYISINTKYQRKGVGLLLYNELIKKARKNNVKKITASINLDNPNSIKLHKKAGFILKDRKQAVLNL